MTQPDLFSSEPKRAKKAVNVPATSVAAYRQRANPDTRMAEVMGWLGELARCWQMPTSAELADWEYNSRGNPRMRSWSYETARLYIRRGLSDALARGLVEHAGKRRCSVAGTMALTWKVRSR